MHQRLEEKLRQLVREKRRFRHYSIYPLSRKVVAKIHGSVDVAENEFHFGKLMFEKSVQVPEFYKLVYPPGRKIEGSHYILMQRIPDNPMEGLKKSEMGEAVRQYRQELEKVVELGVYPSDSGYGCNALFDRRRGKLFLIDFEFWRYGNVTELNRINRILKAVPKRSVNLKIFDWC